MAQVTSGCALLQMGQGNLDPSLRGHMLAMCGSILRYLTNLANIVQAASSKAFIKWLMSSTKEATGKHVCLKTG